MRAWGLLLGGLIVWAAHFFLLYGIASIFPGREIAHWLTIVATIPAVASDAALLRLAMRRRHPGPPDELRSWVADVGAAGAALSLVAVVWQSLPALLAL